jgi:carbon monoxide dehydrogenase subunit G
MKLEHKFSVEAPLERVWTKLIDVEQVAPCLPGAEITEVDADGTYSGTFSVRLGPTTAAYRGKLAMDQVDEGAHRVAMQASGQDKRGQGSAKAAIVSRLSEQDGVTTVEVETDFTITGKLARFGRGGMIEDVSNRLLRDFSECLQKSIEGAESAAEGASAPPGGAPAPGAPASAPPPAGAPASRPAAKPVGGFSLLMRVLWDRLRRLFRRER